MGLGVVLSSTDLNLESPAEVEEVDGRVVGATLELVLRVTALVTLLVLGLRGTQLRPIWWPLLVPPTLDLEEEGEVLADNVQIAQEEVLELVPGEEDLLQCTDAGVVGEVEPEHKESL
jgi:hypothetical protein